jgi:two-component sensor histidine kinase
MAIPATFPAPEALTAEANHRIGNNLTLIAALVRQHATRLSMGQQPVTAEDLLTVLREVEMRIDAVGRLHHLLAEGTRSTAVNLGDYLKDIAEAAVSSLSCARRAALSHASAASCILPADQALPIGLIVGELVTNSLKYAHPTGVAGKISVGCRRTVEDMILVEVVDDGIGLPEGFDPLTQGGLGLGLVRSLAERLGARPVFQSSSIGLRVRLLVPAAEPSDNDISNAPARWRHRLPA